MTGLRMEKLQFIYIIICVFIYVKIVLTRLQLASSSLGKLFREAGSWAASREHSYDMNSAALQHD